MDQSTTDSLKRLTDRIDALEKFKTDADAKLNTQTQKYEQLLRETGSGRNTFTNTATGLTEAQIALQNLTDTYNTLSSSLSSFFGITLDTDGTLAANSDVKVPSQKAVKTYIDPYRVTSSQSISSAMPGALFINDTIAAMSVGETRMISWVITNAAGGVGVYRLFTPSSGTYRVSVVAQSCDAALVATDIIYTVCSIHGATSNINTSSGIVNNGSQHGSATVQRIT